MATTSTLYRAGTITLAGGSPRPYKAAEACPAEEHANVPAHLLVTWPDDSCSQVFWPHVAEIREGGASKSRFAP